MFKVIETRKYNGTVEGLIKTLQELSRTATLVARQKVTTDELYIETADGACSVVLVEEKLTDGSKVYNVKIS